MDVHPLPAGQSGVGLLEAFAGQGFAAALQDGLSRAAAPYASTPHGTGRRFTVRQHPSPAPRTADPEPAKDGVLLPAEAGAVLRRFEERLHLVTGADASPDIEAAATRTALTAYARRILADARAIADGTAVPPTSLGPGLPTLAPALTTAAGTLLTECAVQHALPGARQGASAGHVSALVRALGEAIRRQSSASSDTGDAHDALWRERRRLAQEMHDELGTHLSVALHHLALQARQDKGAAADPAGHLAVAATGVRSALGHARDLITGLRNETAVPPLREAVDAFTALAAPDGVRVTFSATGDESLVPELWRRELFLAVRECLRNAFAHAQAHEITVTNRVTRRWVHVRVSDDGVGFDASPGSAAPPGHGLGCAADRVQGLGGRFGVLSAPGEGTRIDMHVPLRVQA
ncbi:MAG: histidine kinase [Streptomyces sp.]|jgi:signal transduction histidine kinase|nr:histidine kinase [Streptomyces sp.]